MGNKKFAIQYKTGAEDLGSSLLIPDERQDELDHRMSLILHDLDRPRKKNEEQPSLDEMIKLFFALAENPQELAYVAYIAGAKGEELFSFDDPNLIEEEGE